jgi:hypothetical protein
LRKLTTSVVDSPDELQHEPTVANGRTGDRFEVATCPFRE